MQTPKGISVNEKTTPKSLAKITKPIEQQEENSIPFLTFESIQAIQVAAETVERLSRLRVEKKMSNNRANSVVRELKELGKVLSLYC